MPTPRDLAEKFRWAELRLPERSGIDTPSSTSRSRRVCSLLLAGFALQICEKAAETLQGVGAEERGRVVLLIGWR